MSFNDIINEISSYISVQCSYFLCDIDGVILDKHDISASDTPFRSSVITGASLSEESIGTNSVSLCIALNRPIRIMPQHHYCDLLSKCYEYCIPISYNYETIGYIALVSINQPIEPELIAITNLINYKICNEYPKLVKQSDLEKNDPSRLSDKQVEILKYMSKGLTEYAISKEMRLSISTVKYHKNSIFKKYNTTTSTQAIIKAIKLNDISIDDIT